MKKHTKQMLALFMAICTLASVAMPTVFATGGDGGSGDGGQGNGTPVSSVYQFADAAMNGKFLVNETAAIKSAYDEGDGNWRYEAASSVYQFRLKDKHGATSNGNNKYEGGSLQFIGGNNAWYALRLKSPGEGKFSLTLTNAIAADGAEVQWYLLKASAIDAVVGENAAAYAQEMSADPYLAGSTDGFTAYKNAIAEAIKNAAPVMEMDTKAKTWAEGSYTFEAEAEYVLVFKMLGTGSMRLLLNDLTATKIVEEAEESVDYTFYTDALAGKFVRNEIAGLYSAYNAKTSNWRYEAADVPGQFRLATDEGQTKNGNNRFESNTASLQYYTSASSGSWQRFFAVRIQSPGTGKYDLTFTHGQNTAGAEKGSVYILDAAIVDAGLGENAKAYADALAADPFQNGVYKEGVYAAYHTLIKSLVKDSEAVITDINYYADRATAGHTAEGQFDFVAGKEYVVIFTSDVGGPSAGCLYISNLNAAYAEDQEEPTEPTEATEPSVPDEEEASTLYEFYNDSLAGKFVRNEIPGIKSAYDAKTSNWRFEAADTPGQFRLATDEGQTKNGNNRFESNTASLQYYTSAGGSWTRFIAVRIQSPGTGKYDLTFTHGQNAAGAEKGSVYIVDAAVVDAGLGENAKAYADALAADPYQNGVYKEGVYADYHTLIRSIVKSSKAAVKNVNYYAAAAAAGAVTEGSFVFEAEKEYVVIFTSDANGPSAGALYLTSLKAKYAADQSVEEEPENPYVGMEPEYTEGVYDFYAGKNSAATLADGIEDIAQKYEANVLNWRYEAVGGNLNLEKVSYESATQSMRAISAPDWWVAFRIKAPSQDGAYNIKMTHGAGGQGAQSGSIFVIPGDTPTEQIFRVASQKGAAFTTDWFYGEKTGDVIGGRESATGTVNLKGGQEYIVVFLPTSTNKFNGNGFFYAGQLSVTRTGDYVEDTGSGAGNGTVYEFYDWDSTGQYLYHYRTEEELKRKIVTDKIAQEYAAGTRNWCYQKSNGFAQFSTGTPYMATTIGETEYFCIKIKAPGTGTYEITYNYLAMNASSSAPRGGVYIMPVVEGMEYKTIRGEADFLDAVITAEYYAEKTTQKQATGTYTAFQEGKEYWLCFSVEDDDTAKKNSLKIYPQSMTMVRTGDYVALGDAAADDGVVYNLFQEQYANKWLTARENDEYVIDVIENKYDNGTSNWKVEGINGTAKYFGKYLRAGVGSEGKAFAIRIQSPGTGTYRITLKYMLGFEANAADVGELYIMEAPETTIPRGELTSYMACAPIMEYSYSGNGSRFEKASATGSYGFQADKEYIIMFYAADNTDKENTSSSTYMYLDRLIMKRTGDYVEPEKTINQGGIAVEDPVKDFKTSDQACISYVNGHDYMALNIFGGTMMIYDLDEWRLVDEVATGVSTPRGAVTDKNGNFWVGGNAQWLFCYNPYTGESFNTEMFMKGSSLHGMSVGEDGWLYFGTYTYGNIYRFNPETLEYMEFQSPMSWANYVGDIIQKGDYMYAALSGENRHEVVMMDKLTGEVVKTVDITEEMMTTTYVSGMSFLSDDLFAVSVQQGMATFRVETLERLTAEEFGLDVPMLYYPSEYKDGKCYFYTRKYGLCVYDSEIGKAYALGGELSTGGTRLRVTQNSFVTIDDTRLPGESLVTYSGMSADGLNLIAYNVQDKTKATLIGLVEPDYAVGQRIQALGNGLPGDNEILFGTTYESPVGVYNTQQQAYIRDMESNGQSDSFLTYEGVQYIGEYNACCLTQIADGKPIKLFILNDNGFDQARIHGLAAGDGKIFAGTIPDKYRNGGVIAWYDLETELTYVATGSDPEDVYYTKASQIMATSDWYRATNDELVDFTKEWDADQDGDGVKESFLGFVPRQSINCLIYRDGLLMGTTTVEGGTSSVKPENESAKIFIYDVENMKMLKIIDIRDHISGLPGSLTYLPSLEADPDISNKYWLVASETLFSFTYDRDTGKVSFKTELSFDLDSVWEGRNALWPRDIIFTEDYMFVCFDKKGGLCKINRNDTSDYVQLLSNFERTTQIPRNYVLGEDGDIYYHTNDTNVYVVNVDVTAEELAEAKAVQDAIDLISDTVTMADRETIFAARAAWDAMAPANQPYVDNYDKLSEAEVELLRLRIADLGDDLTIEDEEELEAIVQTYKGLKLEQRMTIDFLPVSLAMSQMSILRGQRTTDLIAAIGEVTLDKQQQIRDARASFMALSIYERRLVTNEEVLQAAEATLTGLLLMKNEAEAVDKKIEAIGFVFFGDEKTIMDAQAAYNKLDDQAKEWVTKRGTLIAAEIIIVAEYLLAVAAVTVGVLYAIPATRAKLFKKKEEITEE